MFLSLCLYIVSDDEIKDDQSTKSELILTTLPVFFFAFSMSSNLILQSICASSFSKFLRLYKVIRRLTNLYFQLSIWYGFHYDSLAKIGLYRTNE